MSERGSTYAVLGFITFVLLSPVIVLFVIFVLPMIQAYGYSMGWWTP